MKKYQVYVIIGIAAFVIGWIAISVFSPSHHKKTAYQISDWMVAGVTNPNTGDGALGWARMVVYTDSIQYKEDTASNGDVTKKKSVVSDTFYVLQTPDFQCPVKDSTGKQINNPQTHQPVYYLSWRNAAVVAKDKLHLEMPYDKNTLAQMIASQPKPDSTYKAPNMHPVVTKPSGK